MDYIRIGHWAVSSVTTGASTQDPITLEDLRPHLRLESDTDDFNARGKLLAALSRVEGRTLRKLMRSQFDFAFDRFPCDGSPIRLPWMPLVSIDSVWSYDLDGNSSQFGSSGYFVDTYSQPGRLCLKSGFTWPTGRRAQVGGVVRFTAGYTTTPESGIPDPLIEAVKKLATELYENREVTLVGVGSNVAELPFGLEEMLSEYLLPEVG